MAGQVNRYDKSGNLMRKNLDNRKVIVESYRANLFTLETKRNKKDVSALFKHPDFRLKITEILLKLTQSIKYRSAFK